MPVGNRSWLAISLACPGRSSLRALVAGLLLQAIPVLVVAGTPSEDAARPLSPGEVAVADETPARQAFARARLTTLAKLFDGHFRVAETGQYLDSIDLSRERQPAERSSIAATGIGLVSLAVGDMLGVIENADRKAELTLANLLESDPAAPFHTPRAPGGWFHHWIDPATGRPLPSEEGKYSTIDTALLAAGASIAGGYFADKAKRGGGLAAGRVGELSARLIGSVRWSEAVRDIDKGTIATEVLTAEARPMPEYLARPFDEYVLLPCIGRAVDGAAGTHDRASLYWDRHLADVRGLPMKIFDGIPVLAVTTQNFVSHFTAQFAFYYCRTLAADPEFLDQLGRLRDADRRWFENASLGRYPPRWWGLGAGSALTRGDGSASDRLVELYEANTLDPNPHHVFSPSIIAGFAPLDMLGRRGRDRSGQPATLAIDDLRTLFARGECVYDHAGLRFLWRCNATDVTRRVRFVQAVDLSTSLLGMAALTPEIGLDFFRRYAPGILPAGHPGQPAVATLPAAPGVTAEALPSVQ